MALRTISKTGVATGQTIEALQVSQSADAFTGQVGYKITISGSLITTGSVLISGSSADGGVQFAGLPSGSRTLATLKLDTGSNEMYYTTDTVAQGTQGAQGGQGITGAGTQGAQGTIGSLGPQGAQGTTGANGSNGTQGATGTQGSTGTQGTVGSAGAPGPQGTQGTVGSGGSQGPSGTQGSQGTTGAGTQGTTGTQGAVGTQGADGTIGPQGSQGTEGAPSTVQGPIGTQGADGTQGTVGTAGPIGPQGATGTQGAGGTQGTDGPQGIQGTVGAPSTVQGPTGIQGTDGAQGIQGTTGADSTVVGPQGATGASGSQGTTGAGAQGTTGASGSQGAAGAQGVQGISGAGSIDTGSFYVSSSLSVDANGSVITFDQGDSTIETITLVTSSYALTSSKSTYTSEWVLGANGNSDYTFTGPGFTSSANDPTIYLTRGQRYKFRNPMGVHPFRIQTDENGSTGTQYNNGVTNNDVTNGVLYFDVPMNAPETLYYQCTSHGNMGGAIHILDETPISASYAVTASFALNGGGGGGAGGTTDVFNSALRYLANQQGTNSYLELTSFGDYIGGKTWNRNGTLLNITSSNHGLSSGDVVMIRNTSVDYEHSAITRIDDDKFSIPVANAGGTSGTAGAYIPCFSASVTQNSGDVTAISITSPGGVSGSAQLSSLLLYANNQETAPLTITLPAGTQEGAGTFGSKQRINLATIQAQNFAGTGNSSNLSAVQQWSLGSSFNQLRVTAIDNFTPIMLKVSFF